MQNLSEVTIRIAGDSGDGIQLIGNELSDTSTLQMNDVETLPDFPAEIRAPMGTLAGVSGFQIKISSNDIHTAGDELDVLVALNPAALKVNLASLKENGTLIVNTNTFNNRGLKLADYEISPLEDDSLKKYQTFPIEITNLNQKALKELELKTKEVDRCKNFFCLGIIYHLYNRKIDSTIDFLKKKFHSKPHLAEANITALKGGVAYVEATEIFTNQYSIAEMSLEKGTYRNISGNEAIALAFVALSSHWKMDFFYASYPITPASDVLHTLSNYKHYGLKTFQAEDEIAAVCSAIGSSYAGNLGITGTSGPGFCLKAEAINLAVMVELPLVILNVQRAGPSTGLPTKTEQADLLQSFFGRNGESPIPILAVSKPSDCFAVTMEACRIAVKYMTPVILLSDGYIGNGTQPWKIPEEKDFPLLEINKNKIKQENLQKNFAPYQRDSKTLARPWVLPGQEGFEYRIGGLEKEDITGNVSYDAKNHDKMCRLREQKINNIANDKNNLPMTIFGEENFSEGNSGKEKGEALIIGWGGTSGAIQTTVENLQKKGHQVSAVILHYLNPLPLKLESLINSFEKIFVVEINLGQLNLILRAKYLKNTYSINKVDGKPFSSKEIENPILQEINN